MSTTKGQSTGRSGRSKGAEATRRAPPRFRRQPMGWAAGPSADGIEFGSTSIEPSLGRRELVWMLHELSWEWVRFSDYLGALNYPAPAGPEAMAARAVARSLSAALDAFLLGSRSDLDLLEGTALTVLRRQLRRGRETGRTGAPLGVAAADGDSMTLPVLKDVNSWRSAGDPFRMNEKRDPDGRLATVHGIRHGLANVLGHGPTEGQVAVWLLRGEAPPGAYGMAPAPFDQLREFFRERSADYRELSVERVERVARRVLAEHRTTDLNEAGRVDLAETIIRRAVALVVGKDAAKGLFDADRKRETRAVLKGRTRR